MNMIENSYIGRINEDIVWDKIEDQIFIIVTIEEKEKVLKLNRTAGFLWEHCNGTETIEGLAEKLCHRFNVEKKKALNDTKKFIDQMQKAHLLTIEKSKP